MLSWLSARIFRVHVSLLILLFVSSPYSLITALTLLHARLLRVFFIKYSLPDIQIEVSQKKLNRKVEENKKMEKKVLDKQNKAKQTENDVIRDLNFPLCALRRILQSLSVG